MAQGNLTLICQSGGEFVKSKDGTLTYAGGEAQAVTVTSETMYDDLKLRFAEMCNFDVKSVSIKYFLPGNTRTLISLSSDRDLKRMLGFHKNSTTADAFVMGEPGFSRESLEQFNSSLIEAEPIDAADHLVDVPVDSAHPLVDVPADPLVDTPLEAVVPNDVSPARLGSRRKYAARRKAINSEDTIQEKETRKCSLKSSTRPEKVNPSVSSDDTPADAVKKRRRASKKVVSADAEEGGSRKRNRKIVAVDSEMEKGKDVCEEQDLEMVYSLSDSDDDVPLEEKIASWKHRITGVGQNFKNIQSFRDAVQKYAFAHGFGYRMKKSESARGDAVCVSEHCEWRIFASCVPGAATLEVKKFKNLHTCDKESRKPHQPKKKLLEKVIKDRLKESPSLAPKDIVAGLAEEYGTELSYFQVYRVHRPVKVKLLGTNETSYDQLPGYCEKVKEVNPGSFTNLSTDDEKRFQGIFISLYSSIHGFKYGCRPLLFLETTPLKSMYQEVLLTATSLDGNDNFFPVAFSVADTEKDENWEWFLQQLKTALPGFGPITFVYNREKGLRDTVQRVFPDAHHGYSMFHLMRSFRKSFEGPFLGEGRSSLLTHFVAAAQTPYLADFKRSTEQINKVSPKVHDWVQEIEPECWTTTACKGEIHNHIMEDTAEPYMKVVKETKGLFITQKVDAMVDMIVELMNTRRVEASGFTETLIPSKAATLREEAVGAEKLNVLVSSTTVFEVHDEPRQVVDLTKRDCTCLRWQTSGLPCRHAIAVLSGLDMDVHYFCSRYFLAETYMLTYSEPVMPVGPIPSLIKPGREEGEGEDAGEEKDETTDCVNVNVNVNVLPPCLPQPSGTAKEKKARNPRPIGHVGVCSRCKETGHYKTTCKALV